MPLEVRMLNDILTCPAEDGVRCPHLDDWWPHYCNFDDNHATPVHECVCGHQWTDNEED